MLLDASGSAIEQERVEYFVRVRAESGFPSSLAEIQRIINEYGVAFEWGFPLTPSEGALLEGRLAVQLEFDIEVIESLHAVPGYAGFYFDNENGGVPTLLVTDARLAALEVAETVPGAVKGGMVIVEVRYGWSELVEAAHAIADSADPLVDTQVHQVAVEAKSNQLRVSILDSAATAQVGAAVSRITDLPVRIEVEPMSEREVCSSRSVCYSPHRAGIQVWGNGTGGTLRFGINHDGDRQYVIAGHHVASMYTHYTFNIGSTAESEFFNNGIDARAIYAPDNQVSDDIYITPTSSRDVTGTTYPSVGLYVCLSGAYTQSCSYVRDDYLLYSITGASNLVGASADYYSQAGDSGGPVYQPSGSSSAYAVGIHSAGTGVREFARASDLYGRMGAYVATT